MMTPSRLAAAGDPAAPEGVSMDFAPALSTAPPRHGGDFSRIMSQASFEPPSRPSVTLGPAAEAPALATPPSPAITAKKSAPKSTRPTDQHLITDSSNLHRSNSLQPKPVAPPKPGDNPQTTATDTTSPATPPTAPDDTAANPSPLDPLLLMAMLAQTAILPTNLRPTPISNSKTSPGNGSANDSFFPHAPPGGEGWGEGVSPSVHGEGDGSNPSKHAESSENSLVSSQLTPSANDPSTGPNTGSITIPDTLKPTSGAIHLPAADLSSAPPAKPVDLAASPPQPVVSEIASTATDSSVSGIPPDGTGVALNRQRMKFVVEKNEIAGRTVQKLPHTPAGDDFSTETAVKSASPVDSGVSGQKKDSSDSAIVLDWPANSAALPVEQGSSPATAQAADHSATQAERLSNMVNQEVVMIRQSGANSLAVSLKLDPHTELFLQLTNHNGQIQASLSCERGSVPGLDHHWADLQESLAKQNVQLLPLENSVSSRTPALSPVAASDASTPFQQSSQNPRQPTRDLPQDLPPVAAAVKTVSATKAKTKTSSRQGWESWA